MTAAFVVTPTRARELLTVAKEAARRAYVPYSGFPVGAALLNADGRIIPGCNVENASYGLTICAERNAMARAVSEDARAPVAIAVVSGNLTAPCPPCGACRQVLAEFNPDLLVILEGADGEPQVHGLDVLLANAFLPGHLRRSEQAEGGPAHARG